MFLSGALEQLKTRVRGPKGTHPDLYMSDKKAGARPWSDL